MLVTMVIAFFGIGEDREDFQWVAGLEMSGVFLQPLDFLELISSFHAGSSPRRNRIARVIDQLRYSQVFTTPAMENEEWTTKRL